MFNVQDLRQLSPQLEDLVLPYYVGPLSIVEVQVDRTFEVSYSSPYKTYSYNYFLQKLEEILKTLRNWNQAHPSSLEKLTYMFSLVPEPDNTDPEYILHDVLTSSKELHEFSDLVDPGVSLHFTTGNMSSTLEELCLFREYFDLLLSDVPEMKVLLETRIIWHLDTASDEYRFTIPYQVNQILRMCFIRLTILQGLLKSELKLGLYVFNNQNRKLYNLLLASPSEWTCVGDNSYRTTIRI